ncbi:hypothetical protein ACROYT_G036894 [Oculina patagonica]
MNTLGIPYGTYSVATIACTLCGPILRHEFASRDQPCALFSLGFAMLFLFLYLVEHFGPNETVENLNYSWYA